MTGSSYPGDLVTVSGRVTGKSDDTRRVQVELLAANDRGEAGRGEAEIALPV
jgi:hypothetical protein